MILAGGLATFLLFFSEPIMEEIMEDTKTMEDLLLVEGARGRFYCASAHARNHVLVRVIPRPLIY